MHRGAIVAAPRTRFLPLPAPGLALLSGAGLVLSTLLPPATRDLVALLAIIMLGVPHGALDGELARTALRQHFRRTWFAVFSVPYLLAAAGVLLAWHWAPIPTLAAFLAASVWHFGAEETGSRSRVDIVAAGGLPIALAVLAHPAATAAIFGIVSQTRMTRPPVWLQAGALLWIAPAAVRTIRLVRAGEADRLAMPALMAGLFLVLPPLSAFAIYFVCIHAPAHTRGLIRDHRRAPRIRDEATAFRLALPVTLLTLLLGAGLWPLHAGPPGQRLLCLTIQGLAALTLPHMLFEGWLSRRR